MNKETTQKAIEDVKYIKEVIEKTSSSMLSLSNLFLKCGILFLGISIIKILGSQIPIPGLGSKVGIYGILLQVFGFISLLLIIIIPVLIFKRLVKTNPLKGVSKQIMVFWIYIIIFQVICFLTLSLSDSILGIFNLFHVRAIDIFPSLAPIELFTFAFGLFCINIFTGLKFPLIFGTLYTLIGLYLMVLQMPPNIFNILVIPITFLIIGIYLKLLQARVV